MTEVISVEAGTPYAGGELGLFAAARHWKAYWQARVRPYVRGRVLEVGGGCGANTPFFETHADALVVLEPDAQQAQAIARCVQSPATEVHVGGLAMAQGVFDTIAYMDVLEHIADDHAELVQAYAKLAPGGVVVVLAPAYMALYSPFDKAVGHFRRYTVATLRALTPPGAEVTAAFYLDSVGCVASYANSLWLRQSLPTARQIQLWDSGMVPLSRLLDRACGYRCGKTVVMVYKKPGGDHA